jgi:hypothetical protein
MVSLNTAGGRTVRGRRSDGAGVARTMMVPLLVTSLALALAVVGCSPGPSPERPAGSSSQAPPAPRAATPEQPAPKERVATDPAFRELSGQVATPLQGFPQYQRATLVGSADQARTQADALSAKPPEGHRVKWTTTDSVPAVMEWYAKVLPADKWTYEPEDTTSTVERQARIRKGTLDGYISAEATDHGTEIVLSLQDTRRANKKGQR